MNDDKRLIEDYLPIETISINASGEPRTKGHIATLHIWRARRPLVACRAAVYGALVPASKFVPPAATDDKKKSLGRANSAKFVKDLCTYPGAANILQDAQKHILHAHAERLSEELRTQVTPEDIVSGQSPRPRVLDMFAGGGAIPIEAARLGCEAYAIDLNPVAHIIELCSTTFPQQFGAPLADDVEKWGKIVLDKTYAAVSSLFPLKPIKATHPAAGREQKLWGDQAGTDASSHLSIVAYYWTRTAPCPNPSCKATVPLYRQTWLRKKKSGYVALKPEPDFGQKKVKFRVVESTTEQGLGFNPNEGSENSSTVCPFCRTTLEGDYIRTYGDTIGFGQQLMCLITLNPHGSGKIFIADDSMAEEEQQRQAIAEDLATELETKIGDSSLNEIIPPTGNAGLATGNSYLYGIKTFRQMFTPRQRYTLLVMAQSIHEVHDEIVKSGIPIERAKAITTYLGLWLSRITDKFNALARWNNVGESIATLTSMKRFAMMWDFPELNIFGGASGDAWGTLEYMTAVIRKEGAHRIPTNCQRGSATELHFPDNYFDAIITDPPYYDNESYSELSDVCYVWLKPTIGFLYPQHFATQLTPKKNECVAAAYRQGGKAAAKNFYENNLFLALQQAHRVAKPNALLIMVYAHKTTMGWSTLVDAIRRAGFEVREAWPIDTEKKGSVAHQDDASLASSIFIVARKRESNDSIGNYESDVAMELTTIVSERVDTLWDMGISGADLVISSVGAGLRAFTKHSRVEYGNGDEVPAERFLAEVETVVLETILARLSKKIGKAGESTLAGLDPATRFYVLWRYTYGAAEVDAGEAIIFANGTHVELDGIHGLTNSKSFLEKRKSSYFLNNHTKRGADENLGLPSKSGTPASTIDILHRLMWLVDNKPLKVSDFISEAKPNTEQLRLLAQALSGPALKGGELGDIAPTTEQVALGKLLANWNTLLIGKSVTKDTQTGQPQLFKD